MEIKNWDELDISVNLLRGIYAYGFEKPSPIQSLTCSHLIDGKDMLAQAQSGTGKTGAFVIGSLSRIDPQLSKTQAIILSPTRELALQIADVATNISSMMNINTRTLIGGAQININELKNNPPHIIVGTPGRVTEFIYKKIILVSNINFIIFS